MFSFLSHIKDLDKHQISFCHNLDKHLQNLGFSQKESADAINSLIEKDVVPHTSYCVGCVAGSISK